MNVSPLLHFYSHPFYGHVNFQGALPTHAACEWKEQTKELIIRLPPLILSGAMKYLTNTQLGDNALHCCHERRLSAIPASEIHQITADLRG